MRENLPDIQDKEVKKVDSILTQEDVNELFEYRDGELYWKIDIFSGKNNRIHTIKIGDKAGTISYFKHKTKKHLRKQVQYQGKQYPTARIIFLMFNGYLPKFVVYKDGNNLNTKIENLIEANESQKNYRKKWKINKTKYRGVSFYKYTNKYVSQIGKNGKMIRLGYYGTPEEAHKVYLEAKEKYYGEFLKKYES